MSARSRRDAVAAILKITGDWQTFKGVPGTEGTLKVAEPKRDKTEIFNEALKDAAKAAQGRRRDQEGGEEVGRTEPKAESQGRGAQGRGAQGRGAQGRGAQGRGAPAEVPASETPEGAAEEAESAEEVTAEDAGKSEA